jgi:perosamine synthetase
MIPLFKVFMDTPSVLPELERVLQSGYIGEGSQVVAFEKALSEYVEANVLTVNSATSGLDLAYHMIGVDNAEVISTPITCSATNAPLIHRNVTIKWADIDPMTGLIDVDSVQNLITDKTKAIVAVNWGGRKPDYNKLKSFGIPVVEDAAHGPYKLDGNNGDYVVWSTQAIKFLTTGDGGFIHCPDMRRARLLRWYGFDRLSSSDFRCAQNVTEVGHKYHLNDISATIGLANLPHLDWIIGQHKKNAQFYAENLHCDMPPYDPTSPYWIYTIFTGRESIDYFTKCSIQTSPVHARNDHHTAFRNQSQYYDRENVLAYDHKQINIPVGWWLSNKDREYIVSCVNEWSKYDA